MLSLVCIYVFCLLVVLVKLSVLAKLLARKTPMRKPIRGKEIISTKPRPKSTYDFIGLVYCFIVFIVCLSCSRPCMIYLIYHIAMAQYSLFVC